MTATRAAGNASTVAALMLASTPATAGRTTVPAVKTVSPACTSSPAARTAAPGTMEARRRTRSSPTRSLSSTIATASTPAGNGEPVMIRTASPCCTGWS